MFAPEMRPIRDADVDLTFLKVSFVLEKLCEDKVRIFRRWI